MAVSRTTRTIWVVVGSIFTVLVIGFGTAQAVAGLAHEERDEHTVIAGSFRVLDIEASGSITVIGWGRAGTATIDEHVSDGLQSPKRSIRTEGDRLVVRGTCGEFLATFCSDDIVVHAPHDVRVVARGDGITVQKMSGGADLRSYGSAIDVTNSRGPMRLSSHGGEIFSDALEATRVEADAFGGNISFRFAVSPVHVEASSYGGHVLLVLPDDSVAYRVDASASGGSVDTLVRTDPASNRVVRAESLGGDVTVRYTNEEER